MKLVICLLCFISTITDVNGMIQQRCDSGRCFLCGCDEHESVFNIRCKENQVIQIEPFGDVMREGDSDSNTCQQVNYTTCKQSKPSTLSTLKHRIEVYKNCTFQNSCEVNIKDRIPREKKRVVNYPLLCHNKSSIRNISSKLETKITHPIFYFSGVNNVGEQIDCDCSVTGSSLIRLEIFFIHLKQRTCSKVKFISETRQLFGCSTSGTTTMFKTWYFDIGPSFNLEIRGMEPDVEDVIFFRVLGRQLFVNCSGCKNSTDNELSTSSISNMDTTTTLRTTRPLATDSSSLDPTTTVHSTEDSSAQAGSQTNNTATWSGILAAVLVINIVGIALYCFLRRRRKQNKSRNTLTNASRNGEQSQYNYIDITPDNHGSSFTNNTESNVVQNGNQKKHSDDTTLETIPMTSGSKDRPNNQYHVLEVDTYSEPANASCDTCSNPRRNKRKLDDYDHINDGSTKSKPTNNDTYNHVDSTVNSTSLSDDYNHIGEQNGLSKGKSEPKPRNQGSGKEHTSYVNVNLETDEAPSSSEDVDTYNHLQN